MGVGYRQAAEAVGEGAGGHRAPAVPEGRTLAWISRNRRMSRDYEFLPETPEALIYACMIRLMLKRLAKGAA